MFFLNTISRSFLLLILALVIATSALATGLPPYTADDVPPAPDYTQPTAWLAAPDEIRHPVDIFWVYPTILAGEEHWLMDTADAGLVHKAAQTITRQASVFTGNANLYAPLYRQMNLAGLRLDEKRQSDMLSIGRDDVVRAFTHYLKHENNGRPFILAGHSQGSDILTMLVVDKWGTLGVEDRLVAAYLIGWSITKEDLENNPALSICSSPEQTGCFITYNTMAAGRQKIAPTVRSGAVVVNPLSWKTSGELAPASLNMGAKFFKDDGSTETIKGFTSAQILDSGLVVAPMDPSMLEKPGSSFPAGVYHEFDYSLFYENLRENARQRIDAWLQSHQ